MAGTDARLRWGQAELMPGQHTLDLPYTIWASADGTNWGNPDAIITEVQSRLQDGSLAVVDSYGNRQPQIYLRVVAQSYDGLGAGEAALVAETLVPGYNTLTWTPSEAFAVPTVFDVVTGVLEFSFNDYSETQLKRSFIAKLNCLPFPRSATEVVSRAVPETVTVTETVISPATTTSGWAGRVGSPATVVAASGKVSVTGAASPSSGTACRLTYTAAAPEDFSTQPYVVVDWRADTNAGSLTGFYGYADGVLMRRVGQASGAASGFVRTWFEVPAAAATVFDFSAGSTPSGVPDPRSLSIDRLAKSNSGPTFGTARQQVTSLAVAGAVRTQGRLAIEHETSSLGDVLAYVYSDETGYTPPLRPFMLTAGSEVDDTTVSGSRTAFAAGSTLEFSVPVAALVAGNHRLMGRFVGPSGSGTYTLALVVTVTTTLNGHVLPGTTVTDAPVTVLEDEWHIRDLCGLDLPANGGLAATSGAMVNIKIYNPTAPPDGTDAGEQVVFDEAWLMNLDIGTLVDVGCGQGAPVPGGPSKRLWLDPATVTNNGLDAILRGHSADRSDAFNPGNLIRGGDQMVFQPGQMTVFVVTTNALDAAVSLRHFPRFLHNAYTIPVDENGELIPTLELEAA